MKKTKIYLVRHGETDFNNDWRYQGQIDETLNETGLVQAQALGTYFADKKLTKIYTSPLLRAQQTAKPIAQQHQLDCEIHQSLIEINFGAWEGLTFSQIKESFPREMEQWIDSPHTTKIPQGETFTMVGERVQQALNEIIATGQGEELAIIAHGCVNRILLCQLLGLDYQYIKQFRQDNGAVTIIDLYDGFNVLALANYQPDF
ncbi:MAG: alpha-ribazole phosphatase [Bacillota bacterium]|jgi:alpha-ribazole phosphatase